MIKKSTFQFLKDLKANNKREWFLEHKDEYQAAKENMVEFIQELIYGIARFDESVLELNPKKCLFRINKDMRFSKDKTPYKINFGAVLLKGGRKIMHERAGYYLHIEPGNSFLAGGAYLPPSPWLNRIRENIVDDPKTLKKILKSSSFKKYYELEGAQLKTAPRGYEKDHPEIKLLRYKSFLAIHRMPDKIVLDPDFIKHATSAFKALKPFDDYLNS